jgi:O-antigen/teichoic acid export membrane protein
LYSVHRQAVYFRSLAAGVALIAVLNVVLVPRLGVLGAVQAAVLSTCCVVLICAAGLSRFLAWGTFMGLAARSAGALVLIAGIDFLAASLGATPLWRALLGCCLFPAAALATGLVPNFSTSLLFGRAGRPLAAS